MEPTKNPRLTHKYTRPRLFYEDLVKIDSLLRVSYKDDYTCEVTLLGEDDNPYRINDFTKLKKRDLTKKITRFSMRAYDYPRKDIKIDSTCISLTAYPKESFDLSLDNSNNLTATANFYKIDEIIKSRQHPFSYYVKWLLVNVIAPAPFIVFVLVLILQPPLTTQILFISSICTLIVSLLILYSLQHRLNYVRTISFRDKPVSYITKANTLKLLYDIGILIIGAVVGAYISQQYF